MSAYVITAAVLFAFFRMGLDAGVIRSLLAAVTSTVALRALLLSILFWMAETNDIEKRLAVILVFILSACLTIIILGV